MNDARFVLDVFDPAHLSPSLKEERPRLTRCRERLQTGETLVAWRLDGLVSQSPAEMLKPFLILEKRATMNALVTRREIRWSFFCFTTIAAWLLPQLDVVAQTPSAAQILKTRPGQFKPLTEPPCSYCSTQHRKGLIDGDDRVVAWLRGAHNGGAIPLRHFLSGPRVINDTYGLFFYDPDGGYVAAYRKDNGYKLYGWRHGVMVVQGKDGTLWSALTGIAFDGPQRGRQLERIPSLVTDWAHWMTLHPESTAYNLFDGKKYRVTSLPTKMDPEAKRSMGSVDKRLKPLVSVLGVTAGKETKAYPLDALEERACLLDEVAGEKIAVFWYGPTRSAVAFNRKLDDRVLTFYADKISPESAPFKDKETGSRWTLAGRAVDGPLRGKELQWVDSIQCRWYAWSSEYPKTKLYEQPE